MDQTARPKEGGLSEHGGWGKTVGLGALHAETSATDTSHVALLSLCNTLTLSVLFCRMPVGAHSIRVCNRSGHVCNNKSPCPGCIRPSHYVWVTAQTNLMSRHSVPRPELSGAGQVALACLTEFSCVCSHGMSTAPRPPP